MYQCLKTKNLTASYNSGQVLNQVCVELHKGEFVCLCGPNGSGKSTLLTAMAGTAGKELKTTGQIILTTQAAANAIAATNATATNATAANATAATNAPVQTDSISLSTLSRKQLAQSISFMSQDEFSTWDFTVFDIVLSGRYAFTKNGYYTKYDRELAQKALEETGLAAFANRSVHQLSGGEFQKVRIARSICQTPEFMLLDEPASSLDFVYEPDLLSLLVKQAHTKNTGVLITIHDINLAARFADRIILLPPHCPAINGSLEQVFTSENLSLTFGKELKTYIHPIYNKIQAAYEER